MNHSWRHDGEPLRAVSRSCELCGAQGRRFGSGVGYTRWETRLSEGQPWSSGRVPPCPAKRESAYVPVSEGLAARLRAEGIVPEGAELEVEPLPGDWRRRSAPERPAWLARWTGGAGPQMVFSCYSMRRCAEAPELRLEGGKVTPARKGGTPLWGCSAEGGKSRPAIRRRSG